MPSPVSQYEHSKVVIRGCGGVRGQLPGETHTHTHENCSISEIFLPRSAKRDESFDGKTSNIFNNYTYLQRCDEAKLSVFNKRYVRKKKKKSWTNFIHFRSRSLVEDLCKWPSLVCNVFCSRTPIHWSPPPYSLEHNTST